MVPSPRTQPPLSWAQGGPEDNSEERKRSVAKITEEESEEEVEEEVDEDEGGLEGAGDEQD